MGRRDLIWNAIIFGLTCFMMYEIMADPIDDYCAAIEPFCEEHAEQLTDREKMLCEYATIINPPTEPKVCRREYEDISRRLSE